MSSENPFPLNISEKQDSWEKEQLLLNISETLKVPASEFNKIVKALEYLQKNGYAVTTNDEDIIIGEGGLEFNNRNKSTFHKGYKIIRKDFNFNSVPSGYSNSVWEIRYGFDLGGNDFEFPENVTLIINGGSFYNYNSINGNGCNIKGDDNEIFKGNGNITGFVNYKLEWFGFSVNNTPSENATIFNNTQSYIQDLQKLSLKAGVYDVDDVIISNSGTYDFQGVKFRNNLEVEGYAILVDDSTELTTINGLEVEYLGKFYTSDAFYPSETIEVGVEKSGIISEGKTTILNNCKATKFSDYGFLARNDNEGFTLNSCIALNNGYGGAGSSTKNFTVIGGTYNENGGSNSVADGYGVVGNAENFKCVMVTAQRNRTRNIDSHQGTDIIVQGNFATDAGIALPQWFDIEAPEGLNIRFTRQAENVSVIGNIAKDAKLANISFDGNYSDVFASRKIKNCIISNNICEGSLYSIYIRQSQTEMLTITGNQLRDPNGDDSNYSININPSTDENNWIKDLIVANNICERNVRMLIANGSLEKTKFSVHDNFFKKGLSMGAGNTVLNIDLYSNNVIGDIEIYNSNAGSVLNAHNNHFDFKAVTDDTIQTNAFNGEKNFKHNIFENINKSSAVVLSGNFSFDYNTIKNYQNCTYALYVSNVSVRGSLIGNKIYSEDEEITSIRTKLYDNYTVKDNIHKKRVRLDYAVGGFDNIDQITIDPTGLYYDLGFETKPTTIDSYVFKKGSIAKNVNPTEAMPNDWVAIADNNWVYKEGTVKGEVEIGDWDMDTQSAKIVSHTLSATEWKTVRNIEVIIRNDADSEYNKANTLSQITIEDGEFELTRPDSGVFDSVNYSATSYNRGWINFEYTPD